MFSTICVTIQQRISRCVYQYLATLTNLYQHNVVFFKENIYKLLTRPCIEYIIYQIEFILEVLKSEFKISASKQAIYAVIRNTSISGLVTFLCWGNASIIWRLSSYFKSGLFFCINCCFIWLQLSLSINGRFSWLQVSRVINNCFSDHQLFPLELSWFANLLFSFWIRLIWLACRWMIWLVSWLVGELELQEASL